jgi:uncharacterized membrane protein YqjE
VDTTPQPGLLGSGRLVLAALVEIGQTRLQLASTELEEERLRLTELLVYGVVALFCIGVGLILALLLLVLVFWDGPRVLVLAIETAVFLGTGAVLVAVFRSKARNKPRLLATTIDELRRDRDALRGGLPRG